MKSLESQVIETWRAHNRIMLFTLKQIPDAALEATLSKRGGRDIARQFAHIHMVRIWHLEATAAKMARGLTKFEKGSSPDKRKLIEAIQESGKAIEKYLEFRLTNAGATGSFKRNAVTTLGYFIAHEAHHRGSVVLTMKQTGHKLPDALKWGIWDWNKFIGD